MKPRGIPAWDMAWPGGLTLACIMRWGSQPIRSGLLNRLTMKKPLLYQPSLLWALVAFVLGLGLNQSLAVGEVMIPLLKTSSGEFKNVKIFSRTGTHLSFSHENGTAVIKVADVESESLAALEQSNAGAAEPTNQVPGAMVMVKVQPKPTPDPAWLAQIKQGFSKLRMESAPLEMTPRQGWILLGAIVFAGWFYCLCASLICKKAGRPGGLLVWLPLLQMIPMFRAAKMSGWWFLGMFIPLLNLVGQVLWCVKITQARGKGFFTAVMLILPGTNIFAFLYLALSNGHADEESTFALVRPPHALAVN